jgi:hypothetical protein
MSEDYFECRRCGMHLLYECPIPKPTARQERLVCSECHIVFGVVVPARQRNKHVVCWLIRRSSTQQMPRARKTVSFTVLRGEDERNVRDIKGVTKIA